MGNVLLKRVKTQKILKSKQNAKIIKDKNGKYHCSKCGAFISL
jgi:hypothetical protein